ncbi:MAG: PspC domain-containing protein [Egibacteraceae bacterium]
MAGVASGLGTYFSLDPQALRFASALLVPPHGLGLVLSLVAWAVMPSDGGGELTAESALRREGRVWSGDRRTNATAVSPRRNVCSAPCLDDADPAEYSVAEIR